MSNLNKVLLMGRLGSDPELRYTADGSAVARFNIATSETFKDKSGSKRERTEWHRIVLWGKLAEIAGEYLKKGRLVYIEGKIRTNEFEGRDGAKHKTIEIVASDMKMIPTGQSREGQGQSPDFERKNNFGPARQHTDDDFVPEIDDDVPM